MAVESGVGGFGDEAGQRFQPVRNGCSLEGGVDRIGQSLAAVSCTSIDRDDRHAVQ